MDLKTTQLKDTYGNLLTIGTTAGSPTSGILQNGDGDNVIELAIRVDTTTASTITDDLVSVADEKDMAQNNGGGIKFGGVFTTGGSPNADMAFIKASKSNATSGNYSYDMVLGTRANGQTPLERMRIHDNGDISFRDGSANEAFYWDASTARLGLGTTSPATALEVSANAQFNSSSTDGGFVNILGNDSYIAIGADKGGGAVLKYNANGNLDITPRATFDTVFTSGNVGIGVTPAYKLDVVGSIGITDGQSLICSGATQSYVKLSSGASEIAYQDTLNFRAFNSGTPISAMFLSSSGNVGINDTVSANFTNNYDTKLLVGGDIVARSKTSNESMVAIGGDATSAFIKAGKQDASLTARALRFEVGSSEAMRIDSDGLKFNGDTASANALDDYEEGTFTPSFGNVTVSYTSQSGKYTKIGRLVQVEYVINVSSIDNTDASVININLPINAVANSIILGQVGMGESDLMDSSPTPSGFSSSGAGTAVNLSNGTTVYRYNNLTNTSGLFYLSIVYTAS